MFTRTRGRFARPTLETLEDRTVLDFGILAVEHVHLNLGFTSGAWQFNHHDTTNDVYYNMLEALLVVNAATRTTQPTGYAFVGAGDGNPMWQTPQDVAADRLSLSLAAEDVLPGTFTAYRPNDPRVTTAGEWIKFTLREVYGDGHVSVWRNGEAPAQWWLSSFDGGRTYDNEMYIRPGGHTHYNFAFTAPGFYLLQFEASAYRNSTGMPTRSDPLFVLVWVEEGGGGAPGTPGRVAPRTAAALETAVSVSTVLVTAPEETWTLPSAESPRGTVASRPTTAVDAYFVRAAAEDVHFTGVSQPLSKAPCWEAWRGEPAWTALPY